MTCRCSCGWPVHLGPGVSYAKTDCPQCGEAIECTQDVAEVQPPSGPGMVLAVILGYCGGNLYKRLHLWLFKKPCGCQQREAWLNTQWARLVRWWHA